MNVYQLSSSGKYLYHAYKRVGKHFDLINSNNTSSDSLRPIFPNMLLKDFKNPALFFENEHLNFVELSKYTPRYLADISHLTE